MDSSTPAAKALMAAVNDERIKAGVWFDDVKYIIQQTSSQLAGQALRPYQLKKEAAKVGGIDLSDENLKIKVDGEGMPLPVQFQSNVLEDLDGLTSIIRKIEPLTPQNVPALNELLK